MFFWKNRGFATDAGGKRTLLVKGKRTRANRQLAIQRLLALTQPGHMVRATPLPATVVQPSADLTVGEVIDLFLDDCDLRVQAGELKSTTVSSFYRSYLTLVKTALGSHRVRDVNRTMILKFRTTLRGRQLSQNTIKNHLDTLRVCLRWAAATGLVAKESLPTFPCLSRRRRERIPTAEETKVLLDASPEHLRDVLEALLNIPVRPGDLYALTPESVDLEADLLRLHDSKTGPRLVCLVPRAKEILARRLTMTATLESGFVFTTAHGKPWRRAYFGQKLREVRSKVGLGEHVHAYSMRHRWTTTAFINGLDLATVRALRADRDPRTTLVYEHLSQHLHHLQQAACRAVGVTLPGGTQRSSPGPGDAPESSHRSGTASDGPER
jgi:site-specific recombinase XerD